MPTKPTPPPNREYRQDQPMSEARAPSEGYRRRPEPSKEQVALALEVARRALDGERLQVYGDDGRLKVRPMDLGEIEEA